jgi:uncharacterized protein
MDPEAAVIIMAKRPQVGRSKTRLCPPLTAEQAAQLAEALLLDTVALVAAEPRAQLAVAVTPPEAVDYFRGVTPPGALLLQVEGRDIGECLGRVLAELLGRGYRKALALNADGPSLPPEYLRQGIDLLDDHDVTLGPSADGGYYFIGLKRFYPALFEGIHWSTAEVLAQTVAYAARLGLRTALTPEWYDIDTAQDLRRLAAELETLPADRLVFSRRLFSNHQWKGDTP